MTNPNTALAQELEANRPDDFDGDNAHLIACIDALLDLDDAKALVPNGLGKGSHAYRLLSAARHRIPINNPSPAPVGGDVVGLLNAILDAQNAQPYRGWNITKLNKAVDAAREHLGLPSIRELNPDIAAMQDHARANKDAIQSALQSLPAPAQGDDVVELDWATAFEKAAAKTARLEQELNIANADHIALWLEANTIPDEPMSQCISWLACRIVEAHERAIAAMQDGDAVLAERERCAQIVDDAGMSYAGLREGVIISRISAAIRAGGDA